jgi:hypothetical protein
MVWTVHASLSATRPPTLLIPLPSPDVERTDSPWLLYNYLTKVCCHDTVWIMLLQQKAQQ